MSQISRNTSISILSGVGKVKQTAYEKLGIETIGDLLQHYPRAYENRGEIFELESAPQDRKVSVLLTIATLPKVVRLRSHKSFLKFRAYDDSASCDIIYFNQDYLKTQFPLGSVFRFFGKIEKNGKKYVMSSPVAELFMEGKELSPVFPVYSLTEGLSSKQILKDIDQSMSLLSSDDSDIIPEKYLQKRELCTRSFAETQIHKPSSWENLLIAKKRLVYDEFFCFTLGMVLQGKKGKKHSAPICNKSDCSGILSQLPYELTDAQKRAITEIQKDMSSDIPMSRILIGDVGCGKTICAAFAMLFAVQSGYQAALMAPTEILATQHYHDLAPVFEKLGYKVGLLIGAQTSKNKKEIKEKLENGDLSIVIGTHALLSNNVMFARPGLVVTDEQHRFGARQRAVLAEKSMFSHVLVMSATPIPRSLALALYGDLDISKIDEMPKGRQVVETYVVDESYRPRINAFIQKQIEEKHQVYIVCPAVEDIEDECEITLDEIREKPDNQSKKTHLKAVVNYSKELQQTLPNATISVLYGKMKGEEKDNIMRNFSNGKISILISTTVIEVGVNIPNACLMIVENAERFGLSQLHQLRGRVGRGTLKSYCILMKGNVKEGGTSEERLSVMKETHDGYVIAERDLQQRGPGDFLGKMGNDSVRQSGGLTFKIANASEDTGILMDASEDAKELLQEDNELLHNTELKDYIQNLFKIREGYVN